MKRKTKYKIGKKAKINLSLPDHNNRVKVKSRIYTKQGIVSDPDCKHCGGDGYFQDTDSHKIDIQPCEACHPKLFKEDYYDMMRRTKYPGVNNKDIDRYEKLNN